MNIIQAITEEQGTIILRGEKADYPLEKSITDIDLIADLTELKIKIRSENGTYRIIEAVSRMQ